MKALATKWKDVRDGSVDEVRAIFCSGDIQ